MSQLLLIRHGENDYTRKGKLAGWTPGVHLNDVGQAQAQALAEKLSQAPIKAIYSSPLERAIETALPLAKAKGLTIHKRAEVGEVRYGEWTGKSLKSLARTKLWQVVQKQPSAMQFPDGETLRDVQSRAVNEIEKIAAAHPKDMVAIFSHGDIIKLVLAHYLGMPLDMFQRLAVNTASISVLQRQGSMPLVMKVNDQVMVKKEMGKQRKQVNRQRRQPRLLVYLPTWVRFYFLMGQIIELNPVIRITTGAVGKPGQRVFYIQGQTKTQTVSLVCEKQQVQSLGVGIEEFVRELQKRFPHLLTPTVSYIEADMELHEPLEPLFRVGQLGLGYDEDTDRVIIVAQEAQAEEANPDDATTVRFWGSRSQILTMAQWGLHVADKGRPLCGNCLQPMDPEGHFCPRRNGHKY